MILQQLLHQYIVRIDDCFQHSSPTIELQQMLDTLA